MHGVKCRRSVVVLGFVLCACTAWAAAAAPMQSPVVVESGHWQGHSWRLRVTDEKSASQIHHCYQVIVDYQFTRVRPPLSPNCAYFPPLPATAPPSFPHGFAFSGLGVCPMAYVAGVTVKQATQVTVTLANGKTVGTTAVVPPPGLHQDVRYFAVQIPCGSRVTKLVGRSASGKQVALFGMPS
jgi:hypothetical protein